MNVKKETKNTPQNVGYHLTKHTGYAPKTTHRRERRNVLAKKDAGISRLFWVRVYACSVLVWARVWGARARLRACCVVCALCVRCGQGAFAGV
nr:MAG TPA: hypothetical protein [Caudoviricetes sp.]